MDKSLKGGAGRREAEKRVASLDKREAHYELNSSESNVSLVDDLQTKEQLQLRSLFYRLDPSIVSTRAVLRR